MGHAHFQQNLEKIHHARHLFPADAFATLYYVLMQFTSGPQTAKEIERRLRVSDLVLKFITVRIDEKLKKIEKRKKQREKRAARKPQIATPAPALPVVAAAPAMPASPAPAMPGEPVGVKE